jgi:hypothetical protein
LEVQLLRLPDLEGERGGAPGRVSGGDHETPRRANDGNPDVQAAAAPHEARSSSPMVVMLGMGVSGGRARRDQQGSTVPDDDHI